MPFQVLRLTPQDDRGAFCSGNVELDRFFTRYAGQNQFRHHLGTTYVAVDELDLLAGFATVSAAEIAPEIAVLRKCSRLPKDPVPVLRLARLATDQRVQGRGVGSLLLQAVLVLTRQMAIEFGCVAVLVDAKPEAVAFYEKLGFFHLESVAGELGSRPAPQPMFLEIGQLMEKKK